MKAPVTVAPARGQDLPQIEHSLSFLGSSRACLAACLTRLRNEFAMF